MGRDTHDPDDYHEPRPDRDAMARELLTDAGLDTLGELRLDTIEDAARSLGRAANLIAGAVRRSGYAHAILAGSPAALDRQWVVTDSRRGDTTSTRIVIRDRWYWELDGAPFSPAAPGAEERLGWLLCMAVARNASRRAA